MSSQGGLDLKNDDFFQNLFLEVIKLEIEETKDKLPISVFKSVYCSILDLLFCDLISGKV